MKAIRVKLSASDFYELVTGQDVIFGEHDVRAKRVEIQTSNADSIAITLENVGWQEMRGIIEGLMLQDANSQKPLVVGRKS